MMTWDLFCNHPALLTRIHSRYTACSSGLLTLQLDRRTRSSLCDGNFWSDKFDGRLDVHRVNSFLRRTPTYHEAGSPSRTELQHAELNDHLICAFS